MKYRNSIIIFTILDSPYRTFISGAVLKMQEEGKVQRLKNRWWKEKNHGKCNSQKNIGTILCPKAWFKKQFHSKIGLTLV